jgi:hypothetical protein
MTLAERFVREVFEPAGPPARIPRLSFVIASEQWISAISDGDAERALVHAYRMDRLVDDFVGIGQVERLRRQLRFA